MTSDLDRSLSQRAHRHLWMPFTRHSVYDAGSDVPIIVRGEGAYVWDDQGRVCIEVADNGRGMSPDVVEKIFQPFFTTSRGQGGTGLGLYICYDIVTNRLGGSIRCESAPDQGTRFLIEVPLEPPGAADAL